MSAPINLVMEQEFKKKFQLDMVEASEEEEEEQAGDDDDDNEEEGEYLVEENNRYKYSL